MTTDDLPESIKQLVGRCEINEHTFSNDDMSLALKFGELLWQRLTRFAEHYERMLGHFMPEDIRRTMMAQSAKDMRHILADVHNDISKES